MAEKETLKGIIEGAIQREINAQETYTDLVGKVDSDASRDVLEGLVKQEKGHQEILERYLRGELEGGLMDRGNVPDYKIAENFDQTEITPQMELKDIFLLAAGREKTSHELYLHLSDIHPDGEAKALLARMATEELSHKQKMELLYSEVAFPQTDGG